MFNSPAFRNAALLGARVLIAALFLFAGYGKVTGYAYYAKYMDAMGVPSALLPLVIATELGGGLALVLGFQTRIVAFLLAGFTVIASLFFHTKFSDPIQQILFFKNVAIAGGFLLLMASGAGLWSIDGKRNKA